MLLYFKCQFNNVRKIMSTLIDRFKYSITVLSLMCICICRVDKITGKLHSKWQHIFYSIVNLLIYEVILLLSAYFKFSHGVLVQSNLSQGSILISWTMLARSFTIGVILSLCNRHNQVKLFYKLLSFDQSVMVKLNRSISIHKPIRILIWTSFLAAIYNYSIYIALAYYFNDNLCSVTFYLCCTHSDVYFSVYLLYIAFWGKLYLKRFALINDALHHLLLRPRIFHKALENILELYNEVAEISQLIETTFGSILFYTILYHSLTMAVGVYALINNCIIHVQNVYEDLLVNVLWLFPLCLRGWHLAQIYELFGEQVGEGKGTIKYDSGNLCVDQVA